MPDWTDPQAWNAYSYCGNNPLKYVDPSGHASMLVFPVVLEKIAEVFLIATFATAIVTFINTLQETGDIGQALYEGVDAGREKLSDAWDGFTDRVGEAFDGQMSEKERIHHEGMATCHGGSTTLSTPTDSWAPPSVLWAKGDPLDDYPADPDAWNPPDGWVETPAKEKTGGRHRQWKGPDGELRRWDQEGRHGGIERGPHWHDPRRPGEHIDPTR